MGRPVCSDPWVDPSLVRCAVQRCGMAGTRSLDPLPGYRTPCHPRKGKRSLYYAQAAVNRSAARYLRFWEHAPPADTASQWWDGKGRSSESGTQPPDSWPACRAGRVHSRAHSHTSWILQITTDDWPQPRACPSSPAPVVPPSWSHQTAVCITCVAPSGSLCAINAPTKRRPLVPAASSRSATKSGLAPNRTCAARPI
jgi:hypothetical protein